MSKLPLFFASFLAVILPAEVCAKEMTFRMIYNNHTNIVVSEGEISSNTPEIFDDFIKKNPFDGFNFEIHLNSPGGNLIGGMRLGNKIGELGLKSAVISYRGDIEMPGYCMSACALAFLGGNSRSLMEGSRLGFHQFSSASSTGTMVQLKQTEVETQMLSGLVQQYIFSKGASPDLFTIMAVTPPDEMYVPDRKELEELNIVTFEAFRGFKLEPFGNGVRATSSYAENAQGRQIVSQVDFSCFNNTPMIIFSQPKEFRPLEMSWIRSVGQVGYSISDGQSSYELNYGPQAVRFMKEGSVIVMLLTDQRGVNLILSGHSFIRVDIAGAYGNNMAAELRLSEKDKAAIKTALRICQ